MDRFELLKYTILFEERMKTEMQLILDIEGGDTNKIFDFNFKTWKRNANYVSVNKSNKLAIWKCSHGDFNNLFRALKTNYAAIFFTNSHFKAFTTKKKDLNKLLTANRLVRNTLAHPLIDTVESLNKIDNYNHFGKATGFENIVYFYSMVKDKLG